MTLGDIVERGEPQNREREVFGELIVIEPQPHSDSSLSKILLPKGYRYKHLLDCLQLVAYYYHTIFGDLSFDIRGDPGTQ
jgi:hypothetical protein